MYTRGKDSLDNSVIAGLQKVFALQFAFAFSLAKRQRPDLSSSSSCSFPQISRRPDLPATLGQVSMTTTATMTERWGRTVVAVDAEHHETINACTLVFVQQAKRSCELTYVCTLVTPRAA